VRPVPGLAANCVEVMAMGWRWIIDTGELIHAGCRWVRGEGSVDIEKLFGDTGVGLPLP